MFVCVFCSNQPQDQDVQLLNDKKIVTKFSDPKTAHLGKPANQGLYNFMQFFNVCQLTTI